MAMSEQAAAPDSHRKQISWRSCKSVDASKIYGFDNELMLVRNLFQRQEERERFKAIGIVGVQGIGKSTLCRKLLEAPDVTRNFLPRIWISVSRSFTDRKGEDRDVALVKEILLSLGFEEDKLESISRSTNLRGLLYLLHLQLAGKRYLIVLDDVKESENWLQNLNSQTEPPNPKVSYLSDGLPKNSGGRVIVTSRSSAVARSMVGEKNIHNLLPFSDPKSFWKIYEPEAKDCGSDEIGADEQDEVKQELLEKCRGLPVVAKMLREIKISDAAARAEEPHRRNSFWW